MSRVRIPLDPFLEIYINKQYFLLIMGEAELIKERERKLKEIRDFGVNPYAYNFDVKDNASDLHDKFSNLKKEEKTKTKVALAGRVMALRNMGKAAFGNIQDQSGKIQFYIRKEDVKDQYKIFKRLDLGDIIGIKGTVFKTKTGELSIWVSDFQLLSKSLRPLPEKFHGLKDQELRYRERYVDLIVNPDVKEVFIKRAKIYQAIREFLDKQGFLEIQTPILQTQYGGGHAKPFITNIHAWDMPMYLRIAYELHLKRLLVGGLEKVYDLSSCFRNEGVDKTHNPEFAMMEIQMAYGDYNDAIKLTEELWEFVAKKVFGSTKFVYQGKKIDVKAPWKRLTMVDALKKFANIDVEKLSDKELVELVKKHRIDCERTKGHMIVGLFEELVEDKLVQPTHIIDHPAATSPLAKRHRDNPEFVERVEPFINGWEVGNCYSELLDPRLQKRLLEEQAEKGRGGDEEAHPMDEDYVKALEFGLPPNTGIGVGVDRMIMLLTNSDSIRDVILFPIMKPESL